MQAVFFRRLALPEKGGTGIFPRALVFGFMFASFRLMRSMFCFMLSTNRIFAFLENTRFLVFISLLRRSWSFLQAEENFITTSREALTASIVCLVMLR